MTRLEDLLPPDHEAEWTCGHVAGAMCAECYRILAGKAHALQEENDRLRDELRRLGGAAAVEPLDVERALMRERHPPFP